MWMGVLLVGEEGSRLGRVEAISQEEFLGKRVRKGWGGGLVLWEEFGVEESERWSRDHLAQGWLTRRYGRLEVQTETYTESSD